MTAFTTHAPSVCPSLLPWGGRGCHRTRLGSKKAQKCSKLLTGPLSEDCLAPVLNSNSNPKMAVTCPNRLLRQSLPSLLPQCALRCCPRLPGTAMEAEFCLIKVLNKFLQCETRFNSSIKGQQFNFDLLNKTCNLKDDAIW